LDPKNIKILPSHIEGIDFNKLRIVIGKNWLWLALIFIVINSLTLLTIRYAREVYESESVIKLDVKTNASELGIKNLTNESQTSNLMSGEIEVIQSKLFLNRLLDSLDLNLSIYSIGRVLNYDLYNNAPIFVTYTIKEESFYNTPIYYDPIDDNTFTLRIYGTDAELKYKYGEKISWPGADLTLIRNKTFLEGGEIGYYFMVNSRDALLSYLGNNLTAEPLNYSANTIRVSFRDNNAYKAYVILDNVDNLYLSYSNDQKNLTNKQKIDWVTNELKLIEQKMEGYENYFEDFTLKNRTISVDNDLQRTIKEINLIDSQRFEITRKLNVYSKLSDDLRINDISLSYAQQTDLPAYVSKELDEIQKLYEALEHLKLSYNENTFAYRGKINAITNLKNKINNSINELKSSHLIKLRELDTKKIKLEQAFTGMPDKKTQYEKNLRFYTLYEEFYFSLMKSKSEFEIAQAGSTPDFKILSSASQPRAPLSPDKFIIAGIGLTTSIVLMIFVIGILYLLNNKITNINELEKFVEAPILGFVPAYPHSGKDQLHVLAYPKSMVSEAIRTLRTNLDFFSPKSAQKIIAISSTVSGEGKSFIAMNIGGVMALSNKRVILLDLDMRKPKTNLPVKIEDKSKGISTILIHKNQWTECLVKTTLDNFDYIPSGPHPPNPSELLLNGEFLTLLEELKKKYDFIILDTPPVGLVTDGIMAMKHADVSIYIFRANYSNKDFLTNLKRIISINKFSNVTTLLNALPSTSKRGYGYGYYEDSIETNWFRSLFKRI
jgi:capsular exopolysaccharide synthesis family protein